MENIWPAKVNDLEDDITSQLQKNEFAFLFSYLKNKQKWIFKFGELFQSLDQFEVLMHIKSRGPISVTAVFGHFGVYLEIFILVYLDIIFY